MVDVAYSIRGELAEEVQWGAKSPWRDRRVRLAAIYRETINTAVTLGHSRL